jgi:hypothetical protein
MSHQLYIPVIPGKIVELNDRIFIIERVHYEQGELVGMTAKCLTPRDGDSSKWYTLEVTDESLIVAHTIQ